MLRPTMLALALSCAITCAGFAQQPASQSTPPTSAEQKPATETAPAAAPAKPLPPPVSQVPLSAPVLTLKGACPAKAGAQPPKGCVSNLTRQQFEDLTGALQPADKGPVPPEIRRRFATQYAKLLILADAARELGLENDPKVQQIFTFARNQILAEALNQHYVQEYAHPSEQQIQQYYDQNKKKYVEVTLQRIIIPMQQASADKPKPDPAAEKAAAEKIRGRWVAGEDPSKLEKEAMENNGSQATPPDVNVGARRPGSLPEAHEAVFDLKVGEISPVFSDPAALYIYKVVSTRQVPVSEVKTQISQTLQRQMYSDKIAEIQKDVTPVLNDEYFGPETPQTVPQTVIHPGMPPHHEMGPGHAAPPPAPPAGAAPASPPPAPNPGNASH